MEQIELDWLKKWTMYSPDNVAIKDGDSGNTYTYSQLLKAANSGADLLASRYNVRKGDRVAVMATNELEYILLFFAAVRLGAILVPINFRLTQREVAHIIQDCEPRLVIHQSDYSGIIEQLDSNIRPPQSLLLSGPDSFASYIKEATEHPFKEIDADFDSPCMIIYTSGTTGAPKGAVLTHKMLFWNSLNTTLRLNISQNDKTVIFLPFFHTGGWNVLTTPFLHRGAQVIFIKKFDAEQILGLCETEKATILFGVPTTMDMMYRTPSFKSKDLSHIRYAIVGGEPMPLPLIEAWHQKGIPIRQGYGLTEFGPNVFSLNEQDAIRKIGSIGFPNFYIETKIVDDNHQEVKVDEIGELILRGPSCMQGYWNNPEATAKTIIDGWLYTGDLVRKDSEGYFYVVGRKKDMYKSGGENVYPPEIEQVLRKMAGIKEAAVVGVPDTKWGEVGKAFVVVDSSEIDIEKIHSHCLVNLAKFKIPKYIQIVSELPKGDSGKILKRKLLEIHPPN